MFLKQTLLVYASIICISIAQDTEPPTWVNDLSSELCDVGLLESKGSGAEIGFLEAVDPQGGTVTYAGGSGLFSVDSSSGAVVLALNLDRESQEFYDVTFTATDSSRNTVESSCEMRVLDVNDNIPQFQDTPYTAFVEEDVDVGTVVFERITATDADAGVNGEVEFSCFQPRNDEEAKVSCEYFDVETYTSATGNYMGRVTLKQPLDYEMDPSYVLTVQARDHGEPGGTNLITVFIQVTDIQDSPPVFLTQTMSLVVQENEEQGTELNPPILVRDPDVQVPRPLLMEIISDPEQLFALSEPTVTVEQDSLYSVFVLVDGEIDREVLGNRYMITVMVSELNEAGQKTEETAVMNISVSIRDQNDHAPTFNKETYSISSPEELPAGSDLPGLNMLVNDIDIGDNARYELSIVDDPRSDLGVPMSSVYSVSPQTGVGSTSVVLVVEAPQYLNYERVQNRVQYLKVVAKETQTVNPLSSEVTVQITLTDINDNLPQFSVSTYSISVRENSEVGSTLAKITASDGDSGVFGEVTYALIGTGSEKFDVDSQTGEITLAASLDFEESPVIMLQFQATDGGGLTQSIPFRVNVMGYNDQAPEFLQTQYDAIVLENGIALQPPLTVTAYDKDSEAPITYTIIGGNTFDNAFVIDPKQGDVTLNRPIDYSETPDNEGLFSLLIEASDNGKDPQTGTVYAYIRIRDLNNHEPNFWKKIYTVELSEVVPDDTFVTSVNASDMDSAPNAIITYLIHRGHQDNFKIHENSGMITTAAPNLDIEKYGDFYNVFVYAVDSGSPPQTGTAEVRITVYDANNQIPKFQQDAYVLTVLEDAEIGTTVDRISAKDPDSTANIVYSVQPDSITAKDKSGNPVVDPSIFDFVNAFELDPATGEITTVIELDRNLVAQVFFVIEANDTNAEMPQQQVGIATIQINILPSGDGGVFFPPPWSPLNQQFVITVNEEVPRNSLITQLTATDPQTGTPVTDYREVPGSDQRNYFTVDPTTGRIFHNHEQRLDYEWLVENDPSFQATGELSFQVEAFTQPPDVRSAVATVKVIVVDINDNSPQFEQDKYVFNPTETDSLNPTDVGKIGTVRASDDDSGNFSHVTYTLSGQGVDVFYINPESGEIFVRENQTLDREYLPSYRLLVTATDSGDQEQRKTSVPLEINVGDVNDNIPDFQQDPYHLYTLDTVDAQTSLGQITAYDDDEGSNGRIDYKIVSEQEHDLFYIESSTGIIRTNRNLTGLAKDQAYDLQIQAQDNGADPQSAVVQVLVYVNDRQASDNTPRILYPEENGVFDVEEGSPVGTNITQIMAERRQPGSDGSNLRFSFLESDALKDNNEMFDIDPDTGLIQVNRDGLDFEGDKQVLELIIVITTTDDPPGLVQRRIFINVTNINDNDPGFGDCVDFQNPTTASVYENEPVSTLVTRVKACDADGQGMVYYHIMAGNDLNATEDGVRPFSINKDTGFIYTAVILDREQRHSYDLCIVATESATGDPEVEPKLNGCSNRQKRQTLSSERDDVLWLHITVEDVDDNGPTFHDQSGGQQEFKAGILATTRFGSNVVQISAGDSDNKPEYSSVQYSIEGEEFIHGTDSSITSTEKAFKIDVSTGMVVTNLKSYIPYIGGYFQMKAVATDSTGRRAQANLYIYIVREFQRLRFIFDSEPDDVKNYYQDFLRQVREFFSQDTQINSDSMHFSVLEDGKVDFSKTDVCFHMVTNNKVANADEAQEIFDYKLETEPRLQELYDRYVMEEIDVCEVKTTTKWWSGYYYLWWLLIALALLILIVSLILVFCICYCWPKYKRNSYKEKPYVILDPPAPVLSLSNPDYEWQEDIVKMN